MSNLLTVERLCKSYGKKRVLNDLSFSVTSGKVVGLLGENGIGKTTLIRVLAGILHADQGRVTMAGNKIPEKSKNAASFLLEPQNFYPWMKVKDALNFYRDFYPDFDMNRAKAFCSDFHIDRNEKIKQMSKGTQERVCLLLCLSREVSLYLLDEPVSGFDPLYKREFIKTVLSNLSDDVSVIISTHLLKDLESIFDEIMIMTKSRLITADADDLRENRHQSVEDFYLEAAAHD
jgi:ABC-2 type transport system ATP-binding protein